MEHYRALWSAVALMAFRDITDEPIGSTNYEAAVAFFTAPGDWAESRGAIADMVGVHPDDLQRSGERQIRARRIAEGLPAVAPPVPRPVVAAPSVVRRPAVAPRPVVAWPVIVATPPVVIKPPVVAAPRVPRPAPAMTARQIAAHASIRARPQSDANPFSQFYRRIAP